MINKIKCVTLGLAIAVAGSSIFGAKAIANDSPYYREYQVLSALSDSGLDADHNGHVSELELTVVLNIVRDELTRLVADPTYKVKNIDINGDGSINSADLGAVRGLTLANNQNPIFDGFVKNRIVIGNNAKASDFDSIAIGREANSQGAGSIAFGTAASATDYATAIGPHSQAAGYGSVALGGGAAGAKYSVAIGWNSVTNYYADGAVAIGASTLAEAENSFVFGSGYLIPGAELRSPLINRAKDSLAVGFNSDKATLFVGSSDGQGTTGNVGIGTDAPTAKLDVAGGIKSATLDASIINASFGINTKAFHATDAKIDKVKSGLMESENIDGNTIKAELLQVTNFANIKNANAFSINVEHEVNTRHINTDTADVNFLTGRGVMVDEVSVTKQLRAQDISAKQAGIEVLGAKEAKIESLKARDIEVENRIQANETFTENLFVGTHDANNFANTTTAIVAYEKVVLGDIEETDRMKDLKNRIAYNERQAEKNYSLAKRYGINTRRGRDYKKTADRQIGLAEKRKVELHDLIALQQKPATKKVARVGVGVSDPQQTLHISGAMRLEPLKVAPTDAKTGDMYVDASEALCIYLDGAWNYITGPGSCSGN